MREWLLGLVPVVVIVDFVINPGHMTWLVVAVKNALR
jgi:hypothetical protein